MSQPNELSEKLSALLSDPEGLEKIKNMAEGLFGGENPFAQNSFEKGEETSEAEAFPDIDVRKVMSLISRLKKGQGDNDKTRLLLALRPHLAAERQKKVDTAVKMLKLLDLAPMLKELGLFSL